MNELPFRRKQRGMTSRDLAEAVGISAQYLNDIEHGRRVPGVVVMHRICDVLECQAADLFHMELRAVGVLAHGGEREG